MKKKKHEPHPGQQHARTLRPIPIQQNVCGIFHRL